MKFIFAILLLVCAIMIHKSSAGPATIDPRASEISNPEARIINFMNCMIHCVQPGAVESEDADDVQNRGLFDIIGNFQNLFGCVPQC
ncbi:unnamed protein product [Adineta steineri]|uniref:Uncharacterized protein n=1 Tax=Adineta steineri TaxID=433720 RepID=A0A813SBW6_9BILA|nr:unnamed protein product [Adineta steineri]